MQEIELWLDQTGKESLFAYNRYVKDIKYCGDSDSICNGHVEASFHETRFESHLNVYAVAKRRQWRHGVRWVFFL